MAIPLIVILVITYLVIGMSVSEYTWRVRVALAAITFIFPALFYLVW